MYTRIRATVARPAGLLLALALSGCTAPVTEVVIIVDTDVRDGAGRSWLTVDVRRLALNAARADAGDGSAAGEPQREGGVVGEPRANYELATDAGAMFERVFVASATDATQRLPASFAIVRPAGWTQSDAVRVTLEVTNGERVVRRQLQFVFIEGARREIGVQLSSRCSDASADCDGEAECTVQRACERRGLTCDEGRCVDLSVQTAPLDAGAPPPSDAALADRTAIDGSATMDATAADTGVAPPAPRCGDERCDPGENACNCGDCAPRTGDGCCSPGENQCSEGACGAAAGDNCCSPGENACGEGACAPRTGDNCCSPGETQCNEGACPARNGDNCCSPGEAICRGEPACGAQSGDGCCTPGEPECNCRVNCCDGYSEGPVPLNTVSGGACASHADICASHDFVRTITFSGSVVSNGTNRCWAKCSNRAAYHQVDPTTTCRDAAIAFCRADSTRGAFQDAAWQPCSP